MFLPLIDVLLILLTVLWWVIIIQAVMSWLIAFKVINTYNQFIRSLIVALDRLTEPLYRPFRRIIPDFGGLDFSPMAVLLIILILSRVLVDVKLQVLAGTLM